MSEMMMNLVGENGELLVKRGGKNNRSVAKELPVFTSRMEKREYMKNVNTFDIRNVLDIQGVLNSIRENWNKHLSKVRAFVKASVVNKIIVTGVFTILLSFFSSTVSACVQEYTYEVKASDNIQTVAAAHGVTAQQILDANGSFEGKILLPKVQDKVVNASVLNIRTEANTSSKVIGKLSNGSKVKVSFIENGWAGIFVEGRLAYVSADYLQDAKVSTPVKEVPVAKENVRKMYVYADSLRVRANASTSSAVLGSLKAGAEVNVLSYNNGWAKISFNGKTAFVSAGYLGEKPSTKKENTPIKAENSGDFSVYVVKAGDTFSKISRETGISVAELQKANPTVDSSKMKIGQKINMPTIEASTIKVNAQIAGVDPSGSFRFITPDGVTHAAKVTSDEMKNELFSLQGETLELMLDVKRGQQMTLITIH